MNDTIQKIVEQYMVDLKQVGQQEADKTVHLQLASIAGDDNEMYQKLLTEASQLAEKMFTERAEAEAAKTVDNAPEVNKAVEDGADSE